MDITSKTTENFPLLSNKCRRTYDFHGAKQCRPSSCSTGVILAESESEIVQYPSGPIEAGPRARHRSRNPPFYPGSNEEATKGH